MNATKMTYEAPIVRDAGTMVEHTRAKSNSPAEVQSPFQGQLGAGDIGFGL